MYKEINEELPLGEAVLFWKKGIARCVACHLVNEFTAIYKGDLSDIIQWAYQSGYKSQDFISQIAQRFSVKISTPIGEISNTSSFNAPDRRLLGEHHILQRITHQSIYFYMDDLDRDWKPTETNVIRLKALILALGDLTSDITSFKARIALRTDVYDYINTDEEFFDKYETSIISCKWENADILKVLIKRIASYFDIDCSDSFLNSRSQKNLAESMFPPLIKTQFENTRIWNGAKTYRVLMSLVRGVPRDLVKILNSAAEQAYNDNRKTIEPQDICDIIDNYSALRLKDISREFCSELRCIYELLLNMGPNKKEKLLKKEKRYLYTTADLLEKIKNATDIIGKQTVHFTWEKKPALPMEIAHFLYKIGFITARKDTTNEIIRTNYEKTPILLTRKCGDKGYKWEIHPAYRAALYTYDPTDTGWESTISVSDLENEFTEDIHCKR